MGAPATPLPALEVAVARAHTPLPGLELLLRQCEHYNMQMVTYAAARVSFDIAAKRGPLS